MMTIDEAIAHAKDVANEQYLQGFLCHANPNDEKLDGCIECAKEVEQLAEWLEELKKYKQLDEQGLLLRLPCKVGTTVYWIDSFCDGYVGDCMSRPCEGCEDYHIEIYEGKFALKDIYEFGKTIFLTRDEAEETLKKMKSEG